MKKPEQLISRVQSVPQALWHWYQHPQVKTLVPAIGAMRYFRFYRPVRLETLVIPVVWQPAEVRVDAWDEQRRVWRRVLQKELPKLKPGRSHRIKLGGIEASAMKIECLRHHPGPPSPWDQWANPRNVPYAILDGVRWEGKPLGPWRCEVPVRPPLTVTRRRPRGGRGVEVVAEKQQIRFSSDRFAVGFSLRRPMLTHLGWDATRSGRCADNLLLNRCLHTGFGDLRYSFDIRMASGPTWNTLDWDCGPSLWGGEVSVEGNVVSYRNLQADPGFVVDAAFEVRPDGMDMHLTQRTDSQRETIESEAWRFLWNGKTASTATLGMPRQEAGRTGATELPAIWAAPGYGNLSCNIAAGDAARLQVDSWRAHEIGWASIVFGQPKSYPASYPLGHARHEALLEFRLADLVPKSAGRKKIHPQLRANWGPGFMFRPELAGFSNNSLSTNCHLSQTGVTDLAAYTAPPKIGPAPIELARHTATMALKDGRGYGDSRLNYQDSDPSILNMTGRVHQAAPNAAWLEDAWPFIRRTTERVLSKVDRRGLVVAPLATGNHGDEVTITNGWDNVNFGHYDAYSNAETYRAFRNVIALAAAAGDRSFQARVTRAAKKMHRAYAPCFYNPKTGWFASWRSRDGELHDYGHICVNGPACLYGLVPPAKARRILASMEARRIELGIDDFTFGVPSALIPIQRDDYFEGAWGQGLRDDGLDGFGIYCNGCLTLGLSYYYIRAMTVFGFRKTADQMATEILHGHEIGRLVGGCGSGREFYTLEGRVCGYEGAYVLQFPALLAIAQHLGIVETLTPEFWPAVGE